MGQLWGVGDQESPTLYPGQLRDLCPHTGSGPAHSEAEFSSDARG